MATLEVCASVAPRKFRVRVIGTGLGANSERGRDGVLRRWFVPDTDEGIGSARKTFGGARVHWHRVDAGTFDHVDRALGEWLGTDHDAGYLSDLEVTSDGLFATLNVDADVPGDVVAALRDRVAGLSIEAYATRRPAVRDGQQVVDLVGFSHPPGGVATVAIVSHPALRGEVLAIAASSRVKAATTAVEECDMDDKGNAGVVAAPEVDAAAEVAAVKAAREAVEKELAEVKRLRAEGEARALVASVLSAEKASEGVAALAEEHFGALIEAGRLPVRDVVETFVRRAARLEESKVEASGLGKGVQIGTEPRDRMALRLENLFVRNAPRYVRASMDKAAGKPLSQRLREAGLEDRAEPSILKLFRETHGRDFPTWGAPQSEIRDVKASISTSTWGDAWENVINRVLVTTYQENPDYQDWRAVARVVPIQNFVKQERIVKGGYANLSTVAEGANYTAFTSPGDQGHGYTPAKKGNTEDVTWEAMLRDDVGALTDIPVRMGLAASRTLYETVFDLYTDAGAPTMDYDSVTLYHSTSHSNQRTTALGSTELIAVLKAMMKATDLSNSKRLGVMPKILMVPIDLANTAFDLVKDASTFPGGATTDYEWIRNFGLKLVVVRHWTDANDWYVAADPFEFPTCEIGFVGGQETPELFVQDNASFGSMFDSDRVVYKLKHAYGGTILRHEGVHGNTVA